MREMARRRERNYYYFSSATSKKNQDALLFSLCVLWCKVVINFAHNHHYAAGGNGIKTQTLETRKKRQN
jgi:hypothetical protein